MQVFSQSFDVRWADIDANRHMRHSAYYDYAAQLRVKLLEQIGVGIEVLAAHKIGPILFREECVFKSEIEMNDRITVNVMLQKSRADGSRWTFRHQIFKIDGGLAATVTVDGAWLDLKQRKLTALPAQFLQAMEQIPRSDDYIEIAG